MTDTAPQTRTDKLLLPVIPGANELDHAFGIAFFFMNVLEVLRSGEYRDCLLVRQHRYFLGGGSYDWFWLLRPDGNEIGPVGEDPSNFKELYLKT